MLTKQNAPEVSGITPDASTDQNIITAAIIPIPAHLRERLAVAGIFTISDWKRCSRRRRARILGVTKRVTDELDLLAGGAS